MHFKNWKLTLTPKDKQRGEKNYKTRLLSHKKIKMKERLK